MDWRLWRVRLLALGIVMVVGLVASLSSWRHAVPPVTARETSRASAQRDWAKPPANAVTGATGAVTSLPTSRAAAVAVAEVDRPPIALLVLLHDRVQYLKRTMEGVLPLLRGRRDFRVVMSQDGDRPGVADFVRETYVAPGHAQHVQRTERADHTGRFASYAHIADHFRFSLRHVFEVLQHETAVVLEDDLLVAFDFFDYFAALAPLLHADKTLLCVSAWNDNGFRDRVNGSDARQAAELRRTGVFPGLGWMLTRTLWMEELRDKWPASFWDDWLRAPAQTRGRDCIFPAISRTKTFGIVGASGGMMAEFFERMVLNDIAVKWSEVDLSPVERERYKRTLLQQMHAALPVDLQQLGHAVDSTRVDIRIAYTSTAHYAQIADTLHILNDEKEGKPRTSFEGIVRVATRHGASLFIAPA